MSSCFPSGRRPFDLWVWLSCTRGWLGSRIRWRVIWAHLVLLTYHTLCLIALMWAILGMDSRAFWLWWTRSYGMALHWGIAISGSFIIGWPLCRGILFSVDDGFLSHVPWRISDVFFHIGAWDMIDAFHLVYFTQGHTPFGPWWFLGIVVPWRQLDSFHIGVRDVVGWFLWYDHRSIAFSSLLTCFWDDWIRTRTQTLMRACSGA